MKNEKNNIEEKVAAHLHDQEDFPEHLKASAEFKETEQLYRIRKYVSFLQKSKPQTKLWEGVSYRINPRKLYWSGLKYAAIVMISLIIGSLGSYFVRDFSGRSEMTSISSPRGQIASLKLFDGTTVWLNSESTIQYSSDFNRGKREVKVQGEAWFEVARDDRQPFIVHLDQAQIKVYGTIFNIKAYPEDSLIEASLMKGKIEFDGGGYSILMNPNEQIVFSRKRNTVQKSMANLEKTASWKQGKYYYSNEKLSSIIQQLQRWYEIEFVFDEEQLSQYSFTGVINKEKSIHYNLELIELTNKINIVFEQNRIKITGK